MLFKQLKRGLMSYLPGLRLMHTMGTGNTISSRYCYSVWLRHLVMAHNSGLNDFPLRVAELGPGDSIGIGLAALLSGSERYFAFDVVRHADLKRNLHIFDELIELFQLTADIPGEDEFPRIKPCLSSYSFPFDILGESRLKAALEPSRIANIRASIIDNNREDSMISYKVPWYDIHDLDTEKIDMIYSQAVLEHVEELEGTYRAMHEWLRPDGFMSHQIDFKCHGTADEWNGHWRYSDSLWKLIKGRRPYLINREPYSTHVMLLLDTGFKVVHEQRSLAASAMERSSLAERFAGLSDNDLTTSGVFIQALKSS